MSSPSPTRDLPDQTMGGTWKAATPIVVPPFAWIAALGLSWAIQELTCSAVVSAGAPVPETALRTALLVAGAVLLLVIVVAGVMSVGALRRGRRGPAPLTSFLGVAGIISAVLFGLGVLAIMASPFFFQEVC